MNHVSTTEAYQLFHQGSVHLSIMEGNGARVDQEYLDSMLTKTKVDIAVLHKEMRDEPEYTLWRKRWGEQVKMGSREQIGELVFNQLKYVSNAKTATGRDKTDSSALDGIKIPIVQKFLKAAQLQKLRSTYLLGIKKELTEWGFVHPSYNLNTVTTFRSSCSNPNYQNIPVRDPSLAEIIRRCYIPRKGRRILEVDFSGIEVRIAACYHKDPTMIRYIKDKTTDMHRDMAADIYKLPKDQVTKESRYCAKNMYVFPQFYGSYYIECAKNLWEAIDKMKLKTKDGVPLKEHLAKKGIRELGDCIPGERAVPGTFEHHIKTVEDHFWGVRFPVYAKWKRDWFNAYQRNGGFMMKTGFAVNGYLKRNDVINYPVQGAAFHCLLWCLIRIQQILIKKGMQSLIIGEIHDSLIFDVVESEFDEVARICHQVMTKDLIQHYKWINVPIEIEMERTEINQSWNTKKNYPYPLAV